MQSETVLKTSQDLWRLQKDPALKSLLLRLQERVGSDAFLLLDEEGLSNQAVRITTKESCRVLAAYIFTYSQKPQHYGLDLEFPYLIETRADDQTIFLENLRQGEVIEHLIQHLEMV